MEKAKGGHFCIAVRLPLLAKKADLPDMMVIK
jgi:hypothetical protein